MIEEWNNGTLGPKRRNESIFVRNDPHAVSPIIPIFHYSNFPSGARAYRLEATYKSNLGLLI
jgi:hypothetical protein